MEMLKRSKEQDDAGTIDNLQRSPCGGGIDSRSPEASAGAGSQDGK
jgi:hypothetical protein